MEHSSKILLVEGDADKSLFEKICKNLSLDASVLVAVPKDLEGKKNSKEGVFKKLADFLPLLKSEDKLVYIAIVVDADYSVHHGLGYQKLLNG
jgi:hypothetical protein